jgi:glycine betaine/proline transport system substrate-binding protein
MAAALKKAEDNGDWIVITGWTPHWKFAKWDLKYLEDPKGVYGAEEFIHTIVRKGLKEEKPEVYDILDKFNWTASDMEAVMLDIEDGMEPAEAAAKWVEANQEKVKEWIEK